MRGGHTGVYGLAWAEEGAAHSRMGEGPLGTAPRSLALTLCGAGATESFGQERSPLGAGWLNRRRPVQRLGPRRSLPSLSGP